MWLHVCFLMRRGRRLSYGLDGWRRNCYDRASLGTLATAREAVAEVVMKKGDGGWRHGVT